MAETKYHIRDAISRPAKHHESFKALWETKWKMPAKMGVYPFMFSSAPDFEPVVESLMKVCWSQRTLTSIQADRKRQADLKEPYDWDEYASHYFPQAQKLTATAEEAEKNGEKEKASEYYL
ncbi:hypothetical protein LTR66_015865 [Elasticomyces elasticus]|nr:hypothetical protein LTR66_015865 [Elasticomyces elasticus]